MDVFLIILQTTGTGYGGRGACRAYSCIRHRIWKWGRARQVGLQRCVRQCDVSVVCKREKIRTGLSDGKSSASDDA